MTEGDNQDYSNVNYDTVVENCLSDDVKATIPESWGKKYKGKDMNLLFANAIADQKEISQRVRIPDDKTSDEDRRKFHTACGCPETPDDYEFELPDDHDKDFVQWARDRFHTHGVSKTNAAGLVKDFIEFSGKRLEAAAIAKVEADAKAAAKAKRDKDKKLAVSEAALRKEWEGDDYESNLALAKLGYESIFGAKGRQKLADAGLNTDPDVVQAVFAHVSRLGEDAFIKGESGGKKETTPEMLDRMYPDKPEPKK